MTQFKSLQYALFSTSFVEILGGVFFLLTSAYILRDKSKVEAAIAGKCYAVPSLENISIASISHAFFSFIFSIHSLHIYPTPGTSSNTPALTKQALIESEVTHLQQIFHFVFGFRCLKYPITNHSTIRFAFCSNWDRDDEASPNSDTYIHTHSH